MLTITDFENYLITSDGEVINKKTGRKLKSDLNNCGYKRVTLSKEGKTKRFFVHRLVALHYLPNPSGSDVVNHKNGDKTDNQVDNLEWCSPSKNRIHAFETGLCKSGQEHHNSKVTDSDVTEVCELIESGLKRGDVLSQVPSISKSTFDDIRRRRTWRHISRDFNW